MLLSEYGDVIKTEIVVILKTSYLICKRRLSERYETMCRSLCVINHPR